MPVKDQYRFELELDKRLRRTPWVIPTISFVVSIVLLVGIVFFHELYKGGYWWTVFPAGLLAHAFFIIAVHDAAHMSITRTRFDRLILNTASGLLLLPFFGEAFRKSHHIHHGHSNSDLDPLWHQDKEMLFNKSRPIYVLLEFIPILFQAYLLFRSGGTRKRKKVKGPKINYWLVLYSAVITAAVIALCDISWWFVLWTVLSLNLFAKVRHWCEHVGTEKNGSNNTFWFPLGFGIGNHDVHHYAPFISWLPLTIGLFRRRKNTNPIYALFGVLFRKDFRHYTNEGNVLRRP